MAGPYDYSINIPQPPAQNFLQSLLGIQQLKQMQEQGALQQQQAAFQQQMQPLEMERLKESIAAQRASQAQSATARDVALEGLRQSKITFGREEELNKQADALRAEMMKLSADPTSATREKLLDLSYRAAAFAPKSYEPLQKMLKDYPRTGKILENTASDVIFSVQAGQPNVAAKSVELALKGAENTLEANPDDKDAKAALALLQPVKTLMDEEKYGEAMITASNFLRNTYPERWDAVTKDMKEAGAGAKAMAEAEETKAKAKVEEAKLTPGGKEMSDKQLADINTLTDEAANARITVGGLTNAVDSLLNFAEQKPKEFKTGIKAAGEQFRSFITGETTEAQNLRATIQPFATKEWIAKASGLKGSLSEKEGARLDKGAPDVMKAGAGELLNWMRLVQKVELLDADRKELTAAWQANARSLQSKAPAAFEVANVSVKPGDSYQQTLTKIVAGYKKKSEADIQADAARLKRIQEAEKSGQSPVPNMLNLGGAPQQQQPTAAPGQVSSTPERQSLLNKYR